MVFNQSSFNIILFLAAVFTIYMYIVHLAFAPCIRANKEIKEIKIEVEKWENRGIPGYLDTEPYEKMGEKAYRKYLIDKYTEDFIPQLLSFVIFLIGLVLLYLSLPRRKKFIFNREEGTFTYPKFGGLRLQTIPFSEVSFVYTRVGYYYGSENNSLAILHPNGLTASIINVYVPTKFLSLYVWYMDKNRPLPAGTAFDAGRKADFLRRYREGFPEPLYPSNIEMKEYAYKAERPDFDSDEDYQNYLKYAKQYGISVKVFDYDKISADNAIPLLYDEDFKKPEQLPEKNKAVINKNNPFLKKKSKLNTTPMFNRNNRRR